MLEAHLLTLRPGRRRPALWASVALAVGIVSAAHYQSPWTWCACALAFAGLLIASRVRRAVDVHSLALLLLFLAGAGRYAALHWTISASDLSRFPVGRERCRIYGEVVSEPERRDQKQVFVLRLDSIAAAPSALRRTGRVQVLLTALAPAVYGEYLELSGWLSSAAGARNPGEFDYAAFLARRDIVARFHADPLKPDRSREAFTGSDFTGWLVIPLRRWIYTALGRHLTGEPADLLLGLLFGERRGLSSALEARFQNTGTLHLLAVSGSNVAVVLAVIWGTLGFLRLESTLRRCLMLAGLLIFSQLAYNEPSVVRAAVAAALATVGLARQRSVDPINLWGGTLLILLLWEPRQIFEIGFQLSFGATLGILTGAPLFGRRPRGPGIARRALRVLSLALGVSLSAQLAVLPILAGAFNQVPLVTPLSNLACVPAAGLATAAGLVAIFAAPLGGWFHAVFSAAAWAAVSLLLAAVAAFDTLDFPQWLPASPDVATSTLYYALLAAARLFVLRRSVRRLILFCGLAVLCLAIGIGALRSRPAIVMVHFDLGPRAGSLLRWPDGSVWLVAAGDRPPGNVWRNVVTPYLRRRGWGQPGVLVSLDPDLDWAEVSSEWPNIRIFPNGTTSNPGERLLLPVPNRMTAYGYEHGRGGLWALGLKTPGWHFYWLRNHNGLRALGPESGLPTWAAMPGLPWDYRRCLDSFPALVLLENARSVPPAPARPEAGENRVFRILTSGGVVTSGSGAGLVAEPSIR